MNFKILVTVNKSNTIILFSLFLFYITVPYISLGIFEDLSFTCAAILSKSFLPWAVNLRPPLGSFSTSFNPSRDCKTLRATLVELLQKWLGAVPLRLRPTNNKHLLYRSQCNTEIFKWKKNVHFTVTLHYQSHNVAGFSLHFYWIGQILIWTGPQVFGDVTLPDFFLKLDAKSCILAYSEHKIVYMKKTQFLPFSLWDSCFICIFVVIFLRDESCEENYG